MARVEHLLLPGGLQHVLQHGGQVVARHLVPGEVPEPAACLVRVQEGVVPALLELQLEPVGAVQCVVPAVSVAPEVSQPHVVASICQDVAQALDQSGLSIAVT